MWLCQRQSLAVHANGAAEQDFLLPLRTEEGAETRGFARDTKGALSSPGPILTPAAGPKRLCQGWVLLRGGTAWPHHRTDPPNPLCALPRLWHVARKGLNFRLAGGEQTGATGW